MLKPDPKDPNYKEQMKRYEEDPGSWGPGTPVGKGKAAGAAGPSREQIEAELRPVIEKELTEKLQAQFDEAIESVKAEAREELLGQLPKALRTQVEGALKK